MSRTGKDDMCAMVRGGLSVRSLGPMASVQANGITIEYEEQGVGDPLLLVMGLGGQLVDWPQALVERFVDDGFRVIRFDNRDIGLSTEVTAEPPTRGQLLRAVAFRRSLPSAYLLQDMAADAVGLLDALDVDRAHVVGMSMGGMIGQQAAISFPERVASLVSVMSTTGNRRVGQPSPKIMRKSLRRPEPTPDTAIEQGIELFAEICGPTFDEHEFRELAQASFDRELSARRHGPPAGGDHRERRSNRAAPATGRADARHPRPGRTRWSGRPAASRPPRRSRVRGC